MKAKSSMIPALKDGERYVGLIFKRGKPAYHVVLLPGQGFATWNRAGKWARENGGNLPTRRELALLFANARDSFEQAFYWSGDEAPRLSRYHYAWGQDFLSCAQSAFRVRSNSYRARAVRRVSVHKA